MTQQRSNESGDPYAYTDPDEEMTFRLANEHPALLARVLELEQENERLRKQVDRKRDLASRINKSFRGALVRAEDAEHERDAALALLADAIPDPKGAIDSPQWHRRMDALAAGLSLQEEQE